MEDIEKDEQGTDFEDTKSWLKDNLRIIVSIIIVVAIAGGVYSYSKRTQNTATKESNSQVAEEQITGEEAADKVEVKEGQQAQAQQQNQEKVAPTATSQETESSFIETAGKGDGKTNLARRALANYLEKNPDSALTAEHKIYIEDYLRKYSGSNGKVRVGTSVEFSKDSINKAIESSKQLNDKQLQNLHKYVLRVPSLS